MSFRRRWLDEQKAATTFNENSLFLLELKQDVRPLLLLAAPNRRRRGIGISSRNNYNGQPELELIGRPAAASREIRAGRRTEPKRVEEEEEKGRKA